MAKTNRELANKVIYENFIEGLCESWYPKFVDSVAKAFDKIYKKGVKHGRRKEREGLINNKSGSFMGKPFCYWVELDDHAKLNKSDNILMELAELKYKQQSFDAEKVKEEVHKTIACLYKELGISDEGDE